MWWLVLLGIVVIEGSLYLFPELYLVELMRSFWPYVIVANVLLAVVLGVLAHRLLTRGRVWQGRILFLFTLISLVVGGLATWDVATQYDTSDGLVYTDSEILSGDMSVFYANIFMGNSDMDDLQDAIEKADPDVLALVEFTQPHWDYLSGYLLSHYEYINRRDRYIDRDGTLFASRLPVEQAKRFVSGYIDLEPFIVGEEGDQTMINVVHTASPILEVFFHLRNRQLPMLAQHLRVQTDQYPNVTRQLAVGDFNISPWSVYYERFIDDLGDQWTNRSTHFGYLTTWTLPLFGFVRSHIDHVLGRGLDVVSLRHVPLLGSDHDGFFFVID